MAVQRRNASNQWAEKALASAYRLLESGGRSAPAAVPARSDAEQSGAGDLTAAARVLALDALFEKWSAAAHAARATGAADAAGELAAVLPGPPARGPRGLLDARALFGFAEKAEALMDFSITRAGRPSSVKVARSSQARKARGMFFTPYDLAAYMVDQCLAPVLELRQGPVDELLSVRVLDPAMGTGRFLLVAAERIAGEAAAGDARAALDIRRRVIESCLFGVDRSAFAVRAALCVLGLYADRDLRNGLPGLRDGDSLVGPDAARKFAWEGGFPEAFFQASSEAASSEAGSQDAAFDAIVGNPPYVASKNEPASFYSPYLGKTGQSDHYLLFVHKYAARKYLRPGGAVSFVVPDPILCRGNAESARLRLLEEVELATLVHARGLFPDAAVANAVFIGRRPREAGGGSEPGSARKATAGTVHVARLETKEECRRFFRKGEREAGVHARNVPRSLFRGFEGKEFRYLLSGGAEKVVARLDTTRPPPRGRGVVVRSLGSVARVKGSIFRGEEIGKEAVRTLVRKKCDHGIPILLGGENIARYAIRDDGFRIPEDAVRKDVARYRRQKILLQKSTGRLVAALDTRGFVFPQSVYGILLDDPRIGPAFLLAQLNSHLMNFYLHVMFTGYKLIQPQIEIEDIKRLPVIIPEFVEAAEDRKPSLETAKGLYKQFLDTEDPGWVLEYLEESLKLGASKGSALVHDLLDFLGARMIESSSSGRSGSAERARLEWLIDLLVYRICGLEVEEVELVEGFFSDGPQEKPAAHGEAEPAEVRLAADDPERRDRALWKKGEAHLYGGGDGE